MGRLLASTEKKVRDGAVRSLARYLATEGAEELLQQRGEMAKLWKGIFYCGYLSNIFPVVAFFGIRVISSF